MAENKLQVLDATENRQGVFEGFNVNGVHYDVEGAERAWHITVFPGKDPVNVYWVASNRFYAVKIHLITDPAGEIRLETFDEISFVPPEEKSAVLKAIAEWEKS